MASGYRFIIGILAIIVVIFLWIPLNYTFGLFATSLNSMVTDADTIQRNNMAVQAFYYTLLIIIIATIIYMIKPAKGESEEGETVYVPASY